MSSCMNRTIFPQPGEQVSDKIPPNFLSHCFTLKTVNIPEGVTAIGDRAFLRCENLVSVTLPSTLESIGEQAFYNCGKLRAINIPENVSVIGDEAFKWTGIDRVNLGTDTIYDVNTFGDAVVSGGAMVDDMNLDMDIFIDIPSQLSSNDYETDIEIDEEEDMEIYDMDEEPEGVLPQPIVNSLTMQRAQNLRMNYIKMDEIPLTCNDAVMFSEENIANYLKEEPDNIIFFKKIFSGYIAECFSRESLKTIIEDDKGNYLFCECKNKNSLADIDQTHLYVRLPIFGATFMPYEYILNIVYGPDKFPLFLVKYLNKTVNYSVNYGVYHHVLNFVSAWHCNPGSNFRVSIPVPLDVV